MSDSAGAPISDADVFIVAVHALAKTDVQGRFLLLKVPRGEHELSVRRLGYQPEKVQVVVNDMPYTYAVTLKTQAALIEGVNVSASERRLRLGLEDFYRRRARGAGGSFFTRDEILARNARAPSDVLRGVAGLRFVRIAGGQGVRFPSTNMRGNQGCMPMIWIDGQHAAGLEVDQIPVHDIEGMEIYTGPSTTPMQFSQSSGQACGTIVIWSRVPGSK